MRCVDSDTPLLMGLRGTTNWPAIEAHAGQTLYTLSLQYGKVK